MQAVAISQKAGIKPDWEAIAKQVTDAHEERTGEALKLSAGGAKDIYYRTRESMTGLFGEDGAQILAGNPKRGRKAR